LFDLSQAFVHVSTAYAFCTQQEIEEKVYPTTITAANSIKLAESLDEEALEQLTPQMLGKWPNTYTYTKALAEDYVKTHGKGLPITIFRPAIVIPTSREPMVGWIDNMYGPSGIVLGVAAGLLRVLYIDRHNRSELVPVDYCVNSLLQGAYDVAKNSYEEPPVYNFVSAKNNPITWQKYTDLASYYGMEFPPSNGIWYYTLTMTQNRFLVTILTFLYHTLPGALMDFGLIICGKKPK
jgi:alcohol-forming fatty acyl-CoA reductase